MSFETSDSCLKIADICSIRTEQETDALKGLSLTDNTINVDRSLSRKRGRPCTSNAARERSRVKTLRSAFKELQQTLPSVPPDTKLSKLDVLVLATTYISHLMRTLEGEQEGKLPFSSQGFMHPVKKWPMRTRLYAGILASTDRDQDMRVENDQQYESELHHSSDVCQDKVAHHEPCNGHNLGITRTHTGNNSSTFWKN